MRSIFTFSITLGRARRKASLTRRRTYPVPISPLRHRSTALMKSRISVWRWTAMSAVRRRRKPNRLRRVGSIRRKHTRIGRELLCRSTTSTTTSRPNVTSSSLQAGTRISVQTAVSMPVARWRLMILP